LRHITINFWIFFAIVPSIFALRTFVRRKGKEFSVELMKGCINWTRAAII